MHEPMRSVEVETAEEVRVSILDALGLSLASKLQDAKAHRAASGIEDEWIGDEEFYAGFDDANRHEFTKTASKPLASGASSDAPQRRRGSTVFPNITQPYVDAAAARVGDMLLPNDDRNFAIEPSPIPEMANMHPGIPGIDAKDVVKALKQEAEKKAEKAQSRIDDWLSECHAQGEWRKVIDDAARIGSGVLKGPVPIRRKAQVIQGDTLVITEEIKPASFRVDAWNLFPDPACGESIHNGSFIFERDYLTPKKLKGLNGLPGYINSQIAVVLEEGPTGNEATRNQQNGRQSKDQFEVFYFHGEISAEELMAAGCDCGDTEKSYPAKLTLVNGRVISAALNPLDNGDFPYDVIPWKLRQGMPWGMGISRQMRTAQRIVTAATRNLMDNAGQSAGPQFVVRRGVEPYDGKWEITPLKIWQETEEADGQSGPPFLSVVIPMLQVELTNIIQLGMKLAEDTTGMPQLLQGNQGAAPDTVGGMQILNANANAVLRRIARLFDSKITEPHIRRYYDWLMIHGENEDEKGDFVIVARGSTALVERDIQSHEMVNVVQMCLNPAFGKSPRKAMDEYLRSRKFDPVAFDLSDEEKQQMAQTQPPPAPQVQAAQIRAEVDMKKAQMQLEAKGQEVQLGAQMDAMRIKADTDRDTVYVNSEAQRNQSEHEARMRELEMKLQLAQLDYASKHQMKLEDVKSQLAQTVMKLNVTKELAMLDAGKDLHKHRNPPPIAPVIEPAGRAQPGSSFQA